MRIASAEAQIMEALWRRGALTPDEIVAETGPANHWAESTVKTLINRLLRKKAIVGRREEGRFLYRPLIERADYVQAESQGLLDKVFGGELAPMIAHFARHRRMTDEEVRKLRQLIAEIDDERP